MLRHLVDRINQKKIVLGSSSPRRKELLEGLGIKFSISNSDFAEDLNKSYFEFAQDYTVSTAKHKAEEIYDRLFKGKENEKPDLIVTADTIVVLNGNILEKPKSRDHAIEMLSNLSGNSHTVFTGVTFLFPHLKGEKGEEYLLHTFYENTTVTFHALTPEMVESYVDTGIPMDKAGAYGIQGEGGSFVTGIVGCYFNVMGFPIHRFCKELLYFIENMQFLE